MAKQKPMRNTSLRYFGVLQVKWDFHIFLHLVVCSPPAIWKYIFEYKYYKILFKSWPVVV
jgi:hypothetical protein